jgi:hypothetical protein
MLRTLIVVGIVAVSGGAAVAQSEQTDICPVHHIHMQRKMVWVTNGLVAPVGGPVYIAARNRYFPYADEFASGSCDPNAGPRKAPVYVCPKCKQARYEWALKHPKNPESSDILAGRPGP